MQVTELGAKFADYFEFSEPLASLPSHRILALFRGEKEEVLTLELKPDPAVPDRGEPSAFERRIASRFKIVDRGRPGDRWLIDTVRLAWRTRILVHIESDLRLRLWQAAEDAAVQVFAGNLRDLLLAAPVGARPTMGLDPGYAYVKDPRKVAKPGDVVRVKVLEVEPKRRRISLTMRLDESPATRPTAARAEFSPTGEKRVPLAETRAGRSNSMPATGEAMTEAFRRAGLAVKSPGGDSAAGLRARGQRQARRCSN